MPTTQRKTVHGQVATVPRKDRPGGKKLAESTGATEKNYDNKNDRNVIFFYNQNACTNPHVQTSALVTLIRTDTTSYILEYTHGI